MGAADRIAAGADAIPVLIICVFATTGGAATALVKPEVPTFTAPVVMFVVTVFVATGVAATVVAIAALVFVRPAVAFVTPVVPAFVKPAAAFVSAAAAGAAATATAPPPPLSPAPVTIAGVGGELIEELTVTCGFARTDGETYWPVGF